METLLELLSSWSPSVPQEGKEEWSFSSCPFSWNIRIRKHRYMAWWQATVHFPERVYDLSTCVLLYARFSFMNTFWWTVQVMKNANIHLDCCCDHPRTLLILIKKKTIMKKNKKQSNSQQLKAVKVFKLLKLHEPQTASLPMISPPKFLN
jgi:hypothetical protein